MFHEGDIQSGIGKALTEQKLVAIFVRSDNDESRRWEERWLQKHIQTWTGKAVFLKLEYGSTDAAFLAHFCPITSSPTLVIIDKGTVLDKIESGSDDQEELTMRVNSALGYELVYDQQPEQAQPESASAASAGTSTVQPAQSEAATTAVTTGARESENPSSRQSPAQTQPQSPPPAASSSSDSRHNTAPATPSPDMSSLFPDRAQRHEAEATRRAAAEKAERTARANARKKEEAAALAGDKGKGKAVEPESEKEKSRRDWIKQQKIRNDEAKKDKMRILAQIEADKQERKARSQRPVAESASESRLPTSADAASKRRMGAGGLCSLQVRMFDGSSIKGRFEPSATLDKAVRDWIKSTATAENAADVPFTFKQIIAPQPSRSIEISEEHQSLSDLGLTPNATLVLVPVAGYTEAYTGNAGRGYMSSALHYTYALANGASSVLGSALSYVPGLSAPTASASTDSPARESEDDGGPSNLDGSVESIGSARVKMKTLADQRAEAEAEKDKDPEFYNGNSSAVEGRKDDDE